MAYTTRTEAIQKMAATYVLMIDRSERARTSRWAARWENAAHEIAFRVECKGPERASDFWEEVDRLAGDDD